MPPPFCRDGDACGMKVPTVEQKRIAAEDVLLPSVSTIAPPMPTTVSKPIPRFSPSLLFFWLIRPVQLDVIVNASLSCILFFNLAACSGKYSLFYVSCNRRFGGDYRRHSFPYLSPDVGTRLVYISDLCSTRLMAIFVMRAGTSEPISPQVGIARGRRE